MEVNHVRKVLVVGGAGYLGSTVSRRLLQEDYWTTVYDSMLFGDHSIQSLMGKDDFKVIRGDIRDWEKLESTMEGQDAVILLAALVGEAACNHDPEETRAVNWHASRMLVDIAKQRGVKRFIFASTDSCYGVQEGVLEETSPLKPISLYAELKRDMEKVVLGAGDDNFNVTVLRMATIYGLSPRMRFDLILNVLTRDAVTKGKFKIFGGDQWRPLVHVRDAAEAYLKVLQAPVEKIRGEIFNVGSNDQNMKIRDVGEVVRKLIPQAHMEIVQQSPDLRDYYVDCSKIGKLLGYCVKHTPADGVQEIHTAIKSGHISNVEAPIYYNA